jgi:hypothetical protein
MKALRLPPRDYKPEFKQLGLEKVRSELLMRRWEPEKLSAARVWVESQDAQRWLAERGDEAPKVRKKGVPKWLLYVGAAIGLAFVLGRVFKTLRWGG